MASWWARTTSPSPHREGGMALSLLFLEGGSLLEKWRGVIPVTPPYFQIEGVEATMATSSTERATIASTLTSRKEKGGR